MKSIQMAVALLLLAPAGAFGQHPAPSLYQGQESREIKALSAEDIRALTQGEGMGLAKSAELNRYPGPAHVLQLADALELDAAQRARVQAVFLAMKQDAVGIGRQILEKERVLDRAFATRTVQPADLERQVLEIARLQGELRVVHLRAHLETLPILTDDRAQHYQALRGYGGGGTGGSPMEHVHSHAAN